MINIYKKESAQYNHSLREKNLTKFSGDLKMSDSEQTQVIDYMKESQRLEEAQNRPDYWNPQGGRYSVKALGELTPFTYTDEEGKEQKRVALHILNKTDEKEYSWVMGIGSTNASAYGQLVQLAVKNNGALKDVEFEVSVKFDGKKRDYFIV